MSFVLGWGRILLCSWGGTCSASRVLESQSGAPPPEEPSSLSVNYVSSQRKIWESLWLADSYQDLRMGPKSILFHSKIEKIWFSEGKKKRGSSSYGKRLIYFRSRIINRVSESGKQTSEQHCLTLNQSQVCLSTPSFWHRSSSQSLCSAEQNFLSFDMSRLYMRTK